MHHDENATAERSLASNRTIEIATALAFLVVVAIVFYDSARLGFGWREDGPAPAFFPFWIAVVLGIASLVNLSRAIRDRSAGEDSFVSAPAFARVLTVLLPTAAFLALIGGFSVGSIAVPGLGIYLASALFIFGFMLTIGREALIKALAIGIAVPVVMFLLFERWFLVPLPKGPLEALLGLG